MPPQPAESTFAGLASCIAGGDAPYLAIDLMPSQMVAFDPGLLLWREPTVTLGRSQAGEGLVARGPGRVGFSRGTGGRIFPVPLEAGASVQLARGHALLHAGASLSRERSQGLGDRLAGNTGVTLDRFTAGAEPGVVWVQAEGEVFERGLMEGEQLDLQPGALLCKDPAVGLESVFPLQGAGAGFELACLRCTGPGRIAFQTGAHSGAGMEAEAPRGGLRGLLGRRG